MIFDLIFSFFLFYFYFIFIFLFSFLFSFSPPFSSIFSHQVDKITQVLRFKRMGKFALKIPQWLLSIVGFEHIILFSETMIDRKNRTLVTVGRNET